MDLIQLYFTMPINNLPTSQMFSPPAPPAPIPPGSSSLPLQSGLLLHPSIRPSPVLADHGVVAGRGEDGGAEVELVGARGGALGDGGEGEVVVLQDGQAVLGLLLLQVEHLPQLLQLLQLAERLQDDQHHDEAQQEVDWGREGEGGKPREGGIDIQRERNH